MSRKQVVSLCSSTLDLSTLSDGDLGMLLDRAGEEKRRRAEANLRQQEYERHRAPDIACKCGNDDLRQLHVEETIVEKRGLKKENREPGLIFPSTGNPVNVECSYTFYKTDVYDSSPSGDIVIGCDECGHTYPIPENVDIEMY